MCIYVYIMIAMHSKHHMINVLISPPFSLEMAEPYKKAVVYIFTSQYANLSSILQGSIMTFAERAYSAGLISGPVKEATVQCTHDQYSKCFADIVNEFTGGFQLKRNIEDIMKHCRKLTQILEDLGGPVEDAGKELDTKLSTLVGM